MITFHRIFCLVGALLMLAPKELLLAQEEGQVILISERVGETIDREERDRYGLFPGSDNFHSAVIIQRPDSSYAAQITEETGGRMQTRLLPIDQNALKLLRQRIAGTLPKGESFLAKVNPMIVITDRDLHQWEGQLLGMEADSVMIAPPESHGELEPKRISILDVQGIIVRKTTKFHQGASQGASTGCLFGIILGAFAALSVGKKAAGLVLIPVAATGALLGAVAGAGVGGLSSLDGYLDLSEKSPEERIKILRQIAGLQVQYE